MAKLLEFFAEDNGHLSNMRLNTTLLVMASVFIAIFAVVNSKLDGSTVSMSTLFATLGLGGKVAQKMQEEKTGA